MRRLILAVIIMLICISLAACNTNSNLLENITTPPDEEKDEQPQEEPTPVETDEPQETPKPTIEPTPEPTQTQTPEPEDEQKINSLSFAHADLVYADPDAYKGQEYASPFKILTEPMWYENVLVSYAVGFTNSNIQTFTALVFDGEAPELSVDEFVYVRGTIDGKGFTYDSNNNAVDLMLLYVEEVEKDIVSAGVQPNEKEISFDEGEFAAQSDTLRIEVSSLTFQQGTMFLSTKTFDEAAEEFTTYYLDIIIHQDGYFAWYHDCNYWINKDVEGYDNVPFPMLQTNKDMTIEFVPFSEDGELLYEPLVIELELGGE